MDSVALVEHSTRSIQTAPAFNCCIASADRTLTTNSAFTGVILSGSTLYGTTGYESQGTVFTIQSDGTGFQTLHNMASADGQTFF